MSEHFRAGDRVRVRTGDPPGHTRVPRYVRGAVGTVVESQGRYPLADERARGRAAVPPEPVYTVRFAACDLWGSGDHSVTVDLWETYLTGDADDR
ncbi:MAG TPA: SH3-like domain-containing protein [Chloroflexota bacterium]|nr:SH3-like domain-containing protein [Chloroflexota bacterium]